MRWRATAPSGDCARRRGRCFPFMALPGMTMFWSRGRGTLTRPFAGLLEDLAAALEAGHARLKMPPAKPGRPATGWPEESAVTAVTIRSAASLSARAATALLLGLIAVLPQFPLAAVSAGLRFRADLFGLCGGSNRTARTAERHRARDHGGCCAAIPSPGWADRAASIRCRRLTLIRIRKRVMSENRNLLLAVLLSAAVLFGWQYFVAMPQIEAAAQGAADHPSEQTRRSRSAGIRAAARSGGRHRMRCRATQALKQSGARRDRSTRRRWTAR